MVKIMKKLVSRSEFARIAGITPGAVTKACKKNLAPATIGKRIDVNHPAAVEYLQRRDGTTTTVNGWTAKNEAEKKQAIENLESVHGTAYLNMTLRGAVATFGRHPAFSDFLRATKLIEDINEKRLKNKKTMGELVSRDLIKTGIIDPINKMADLLLTDGAKTMARRTTEMNSAGRTLEEIEKFIVDQISSHIKQIKSETLKRLQND